MHLYFHITSIVYRVCNSLLVDGRVYEKETCAPLSENPVSAARE